MPRIDRSHHLLFCKIFYRFKAGVRGHTRSFNWNLCNNHGTGRGNFPIPVTADHQFPGGPGDLVRQRHGGDFGLFALKQAKQLW